MFNEKDPAWIQLYKIFTIVGFFAIAIFGIIAGIGDYTSDFLDLDLGGDTFFDIVVWFVGSVAIGYILLIFNMLTIQLVANIQTIREKIERN